MGLRLTKTKNVTYMGRAAKVWDLLATANKLGERVSLVRWIEDADERNGGHKAGTVVARHCKGDGQRRDFVQYAERAFHGETAEADALEWSHQRLAEGSIDCTPSSSC